MTVEKKASITGENFNKKTLDWKRGLEERRN